jgi:hypothetical protein
MNMNLQDSAGDFQLAILQRAGLKLPDNAGSYKRQGHMEILHDLHMAGGRSRIAFVVEPALVELPFLGLGHLE